MESSIRWLNLTYSIYYELIIAGVPFANSKDVMNFLSVIQWKLDGVVSSDEFSQLYSIWMTSLSTQNDEVLPYKDFHDFLTDYDELTLESFIEILFKERSQTFVRTIPSSNDRTSQEIFSLIEEIFKLLDIQECGYLTVVDLFFLTISLLDFDRVYNAENLLLQTRQLFNSMRAFEGVLCKTAFIQFFIDNKMKYKSLLETRDRLLSLTEIVAPNPQSQLLLHSLPRLWDIAARNVLDVNDKNFSFYVVECPILLAHVIGSSNAECAAFLDDQLQKRLNMRIKNSLSLQIISRFVMLAGQFLRVLNIAPELPPNDQPSQILLPPKKDSFETVVLSDSESQIILNNLPNPAPRVQTPVASPTSDAKGSINFVHRASNVSVDSFSSFTTVTSPLAQKKIKEFSIEDTMDYTKSQIQTTPNYSKETIALNVSDNESVKDTSSNVQNHFRSTEPLQLSRNFEQQLHDTLRAANWINVFQEHRTQQALPFALPLPPHEQQNQSHPSYSSIQQDSQMEVDLKEPPKWAKKLVKDMVNRFKDTPQQKITPKQLGIALRTISHTPEFQTTTHQIRSRKNYQHDINTPSITSASSIDSVKSVGTFRTEVKTKKKSQDKTNDNLSTKKVTTLNVLEDACVNETREKPRTRVRRMKKETLDTLDTPIIIKENVGKRRNTLVSTHKKDSNMSNMSDKRVKWKA
eukprot:TRINITY_DN2721_c0_g2_i1.p1 TRINITY_DN2721_c0_g2~~TRINITY_DN2721_c0_g2_i1.p1  ORF type:complete len:691 (+),score=133.21 TRINITY_DN2721_c0_g2_i1:53-2125(+)